MKRPDMRLAILALCAIAGVVRPGAAQQQIPSKVDVAFNRFYNYDEYTDVLKKLVAAYPELLTMQSIGRSEQGRELWLVTLNNPKTGKDTDKPAMWMDGNVHGNEIQASETVIYAIWYLTKSYGKVDSLTKLMDRAAFYFLPSQNPDGRDQWFKNPTTPNDYRSGQRPTDNDFDGLLDEDGPEDLDGDGNIGVMWRFDPNGQFRRHRDDPRIIERVPEGERGELSFAGSEGIDNDGDGQINEDGPGGYDMNRNWPTDWQPNYIQFGAGEYPLDFPEVRAITRFILDHPNIAAGQSFHNAGGMILRGPGAQYAQSSYPGPDVNVYDRLGRAGEEMLPYYNYLVIFSGLYTVHGGFVNWLSEGLGIVSFTNELWTDDRILGKASGAGDDETGSGRRGQRDPDQQKARMRWIDRVLFGQTFTNFTEYEHPTLGKVLIGGGTKWSSRIPPPFMLEEECHRNFAFTMFHADNMPLLSFNWIEVKPLSSRNDIWQITVEIENSKIIPTRTAWAAQKQIGFPDRLTLTGEGVNVVASGTLNDRFDKTLDPIDYRKNIIDNDRGIPSQGRQVFRFLVTGKADAQIELAYRAEKAQPLSTSITLKEVTISAADQGSKPTRK